MATSTLDDSCRVPSEFHISSSVEDNGSRISLNNQKCSLCNTSKKTFYCKQCIRNGDFVRLDSKQNSSERFAEKQLRLSSLKTKIHVLEKKYWELENQKHTKFNIEQDIKDTRFKIKLLKLSAKDKKAIIAKQKNQIAELKDYIEKISKKSPKYEGRVFKLKIFVTDKREDIEHQRLKCSKKNAEVKEYVRKCIEMLTKYIFPISQVLPSRNEEDTTQETIRALADASRMSYYQGRWVFTDSTGELQHCIAGPTLPGSGNYSAYNDYVILNKDGTLPTPSDSGALDLDPAFKISDALTYTCQLINALAFYLDVKLPHRMSISDYCSNFLSEKQFSRRVARLNCNVLYLCLTQSVPITKLQPLHTLENVLCLLDTKFSDLGRQGPLEMPIWLDDVMEEFNKDLLGGEESDSDDGDHLPREWEAVSSEVPLVNDDIFGNSSNAHMSNTQQAASVAGGLVTTAAASIASIWRGWTTGK